MYSQINKQGFANTTTSAFAFGVSSLSNQKSLLQPSACFETIHGMNSTLQQSFGAPLLNKPGFTNLFDQKSFRSSLSESQCNTSFRSPTESFKQSTISTLQTPNLYGPSTVFGKTSDVFGQPLMLHDSSNSYERPTNVFGQSSHSFVKSENFLGQSQNIFGQPSVLFKQSENLFGHPPALFRQPKNTCGAFENSTFEQQNSIIGYNPTYGTDNIPKNGMPNIVNTKLCCITCMKEYEDKSLEELRFENYKDKLNYAQSKTTVPVASNQIHSKPTEFGETNFSTTHLGLFTNPFNIFSNPVMSPTASIKPFQSQLTQSIFNPVICTTPSPGFTGNTFSFGTTQQQSTGLLNKFTMSSAQAPSRIHPPNSQNISSPSKLKFSNNSFTPQTATVVVQSSHHTPCDINKSFQYSFGPTQSGSSMALFTAPNTATATPSLSSVPQKQIVVKTGEDYEIELQEFYKSVQQIFQPFPRHEFLKSGQIVSHENIIPKCSNSSNISKASTITNKTKIIPNIVRKTFATNDIIPVYAIPPTSKRLVLKPKIPNNVKTFVEVNKSKLFVINNQEISQENTQEHQIENLKKKRELLINVSNESSDSESSDSFPDHHLSNTNLRSKICAHISSVKNSCRRRVKKSTGTQTIGIFGKIQEAGESSIANSDFNSDNEIIPKIDSMKISTMLNNEGELKEIYFHGDCIESVQTNFSKDFDFLNLVTVPYIIKLERPEYYTMPPVNELHKYVNDSGNCPIKGFTIGRMGYGSIYFPNEIDIANIDFDKIVHFGYREVIVYPDDDEKPPVGEGLNRQAEVTLDQIWPLDRDSGRVLKDPEEIERVRFKTRLSMLSEKQDAKFLDYNATTGSWVFNVEHFSRYCFSDTGNCKIGKLM